MSDVTLEPRDTSGSNSLRAKVVDAHAAGHVTGKEAARIVGSTYRRVDYAAREGIAPPLIEAEGSGTLRHYDLDSLVRLKIATDLADSGIRATERIRHVLDEIEVNGGNPVRVVAGALVIEVDPSQAREAIEPAYLSTINPDPKDQP